ncbi:hypothetical protein HK100_008831 [Physocladia obscura]|uniref:Uncharacterized protein n=1 Tax=Physocladia obscura TaxID=109957 RepID=A0AAD5T4V3_9FUNG|nr:hypothetical protein HK100_008831 [Physocladia obscura]
MNEPLQSLEYLCFQGSNPSPFESIEHGFNIKFSDNQPTALFPVFTNFLNFTEEEGEAKNLRQAIILRAVANKTLGLAKNLEHNSLNFPDNTVIDLFFEDVGEKSPQGDVPCRKYFIVNKELATPEFFVEFSLECELDKFTTKSEKLMLDIAYSNKLSQADMPSIVMDIVKKISGTDKNIAALYDSFTMNVIASQFPEIKQIENFVEPPAIEQTLEILSKQAPANIEYLNLSKYSKLPPMTTFRLFGAIKTLILSECSLKEVPSNLKYFPLLSTLDLSFNAISSLNSLLDLAKNLQYLDIAGNHIFHTTELDQIQKNFVELFNLDLRLNPVCKFKGYLQLLLGNGGFAKLKYLDGNLIDTAMKRDGSKPLISTKNFANFDDCEKTWDDVLFKNSSTQQHLFRPLSVRTQSGYGSSAALNEYWRISSEAFEDQTFIAENITTLELDGCGLHNLDMLPLGWASFRMNNISDVSKLTMCLRLEEISLEDNEIESIDVLSSLSGLTKLDVSKNKIKVVENAGKFSNLMFLSLENNFIQTIKPFAQITSLMEFCEWILDGASITPKEQSLAKEIYLGKLTIELLGAKIGHFSFRNISELDLRNCKIKEADCFIGSQANEFRNIRRLQFDNNQLVSLDAFASLQGLRCLCLNSNRIDKILSADVPAVLGLNGWKVDNAEFHRKTIFSSLEELHLGNNNISRIADLGLYRLGQLKRLYLQGNKISRSLQ